MSDYLLLKNQDECPKCRRKSFHRYNGPCANCGTMLFMHEADFAKYEADGNSLEWWFYRRDNGWMHRSQVMMREEAQERQLEIKTPPPNIKTVSERIADVKKSVKEKMKLPSGKLFGRGKSKTRIA